VPVAVITATWRIVEPCVNTGASSRAVEAADMRRTWGLGGPRLLYVLDRARQLDFAGSASQDTAPRLG